MSRALPTLALVGLMGAGKTTVGRLMAAHLARPFVDLDREIVAAAGHTIAQIFTTEGEQGFRTREQQALAATLERDEPLVVATGGGVVLRSDNRRLLSEHCAVAWLKISPEAAAARIGGDSGRPLLGDDPVDALRRLDGQRSHLYAQVADVVVDAERPEGEVAARLVTVLAALVADDDG